MKSFVPLHYVPIEDDGLHIQVMATVNNQNVRLVADTGASRTVFDSGRAKRLQGTDQRTVANLEAHGLGEDIQSFLLQVEEIRFAHKKLTDYTCVLVDLQPMNDLFVSLNAPTIRGILGGDLLSGLHGIINYKKKTLKLAGKNFPLEFLSFPDGSFHLVVHLQVDGTEAVFLLDSGASKTVFDLNGFCQIHPFEASELTANDKPSAGIHIETTEHQTILLEKISFGYLSLPATEVLLLDLANINYTYSLLNLPHIDGILGNDILQRLEAVINYKKKTLRLKD